MSKIDQENRAYVFLDPGGKRWPRLRRILVLLGVMVFLGLVLFIQTLFVRPELQLPMNVRKLKGQLKALSSNQRQSPRNRRLPGKSIIQKASRCRNGWQN